MQRVNRSALVIFCLVLLGACGVDAPTGRAPEATASDPPAPEMEGSDRLFGVASFAGSVPASAGLSRSLAVVAAPAAGEETTRTSTATDIRITFEGLGNRATIPTVGFASFPGWLAHIDMDVPPGYPTNTALVANEPSASTTIFWYYENVPSTAPSFREITLARPVNRVSVEYAACLSECLGTGRRDPSKPAVLPHITLIGYDAAGAVVDSAKGLENWGDGIGDPTGAFSKWDPMAVDVDDPDNRIVRVRITGYENNVDVDDVRIRTVNFVPRANLGGPYVAAEGSTVSLNGSGSYDPVDAAGLPHPAADPITYLWNLGAAGSATTAVVQSGYGQNGTYPISLTVTDPNGASQTASGQVIIGNVSPQVTAPANGQTQVGQAYSWTASFADPGRLDGPWTYQIDWGDGTPLPPVGQVGSWSEIMVIAGSHGYAQAGTYTATVKVTDRDGGIGQAATTVVVLGPSNRPPVAAPGGTPTGYTGVEGTPISFSGSGSSDPDNDALTYAWSFGDGGTATGASPTYTYAADGDFPVSLTVTDAKGLTSTATTVARIANVPPSIGPIADLSVPVSTAFSQLVAFTDPGADSWSGTVDFGDGTPAQPYASVTSPFSVGKSYPTVGPRTVTVTVSDGKATGTRSFAVNVFQPNRPPVVTASAIGSVVPCTASGVRLNGTATDADGDGLKTEWYEGASLLSSTLSPTLALAPGPHTLELRVTELRTGGVTVTATVQVTVTDNTKPGLTVTATPGYLWPPNHAYHTIAVGSATTDVCTVTPISGIAGFVRSNEPDESTAGGDGNTTGDIRVTHFHLGGTQELSSNSRPEVAFHPGDQLEVRAERLGEAAPRIYTISLTATDASGSATTTAEVRVERDQGKR